MKKGILLPAVLFGLLYSGNFADLRAAEDPPQIGGISSVSLNEEKRLGRIWWRKNYRRFNPVSDYFLQSYLEHLVSLLAQTEQMKAYDLQAHVLPEKSLNAFAAPGGIIGIHLGLWYYAETEDEFASVIAHELAHLSQRHFARMLEDAKSRSSVSLASVLAGIGLMLSGNPSAGALAIYGSVGYQQERFLALSRRFEREADNIAYSYMERGGFSARGALNMFHCMEALARGAEVPEYMSGHPLTQERLDTARLRAADAPVRVPQQTDNPADYPFVRLRALSHMDALDTATNKPQAERDYAEALKLQARGRHTQAADLLLHLAAEFPKSRFLFFSAIDAQLRANRATAARRSLEAGRKYLGESAILHYFLARVAEQQQDWDVALASMLRVLKENEEDEVIWQHLATYYAKLENNYAYYRADAVYRTLTGQERAAQRSLKLAKEHAQDDAILLAQLEDMRTRFDMPPD